MIKNKTDIEIAADAIKYCRRELEKYNNLLSKYDEDFEKEIISERTVALWEYEKQKLEYVLGLNDKRPIFPYVQKEIKFNDKAR